MLKLRAGGVQPLGVGQLKAAAEQLDQPLLLHPAQLAGERTAVTVQKRGQFSAGHGGGKRIRAASLALFQQPHADAPAQALAANQLQTAVQRKIFVADGFQPVLQQLQVCAVQRGAGAQQCLAGKIQCQTGLGGGDIDGAAAAPARQHVGKDAARPHTGHDDGRAVGQRFACRDSTFQHKADFVGLVARHQQQLAFGVAAHPRRKAGHQRVQLGVRHAAQKACAAHRFVVGCVVHTAPCKWLKRVSVARATDNSHLL